MSSLPIKGVLPKDLLSTKRFPLQRDIFEPPFPLYLENLPPGGGGGHPSPPFEPPVSRHTFTLVLRYLDRTDSPPKNFYSFPSSSRVQIREDFFSFSGAFSTPTLYLICFLISTLSFSLPVCCSRRSLSCFPLRYCDDPRFLSIRL